MRGTRNPPAAPKDKERGYVLSIDPASNKCGAALWKNGSLVGTALLESNSHRDPFSVRLQTIALQLDMFLREHVGEGEKVGTVLCEGVRSVLVQICIGALLTAPQIEASMTHGSFVYPTSWKKYAKDRGASGVLKDIKGNKALSEIGWPRPPESDDVCDAILIYLAWRARA